MGFFDRLNLDDISRKLNDLGQEAFNQGAALAGTAKNKVKSADVERQLNNKYAELGRAYFQNLGDNVPEEQKELVAQIKDLITQVEFYKNEARREKGIILCPKCGAEVTMGTMYCSACGSVVPQPGVVQSVTCPQCGRSLPAGTQFCTGCGTNVSSVAPVASQMPLGQVDLNGGTISSFAPPVTQQPAQTFNSAPVTQQPAPTFNSAPATQQPAPTFNPAPAIQQPAPTFDPAPAAPNFLTKQPEAPATQQPAPTFNPAPAAPNFLTKQPEAPAAQQPAPTFDPAPAAPQQMGGIPQGGPGGFAMDIDTSVVYGNTNN